MLEEFPVVLVRVVAPELLDAANDKALVLIALVVGNTSSWAVKKEELQEKYKHRVSEFVDPVEGQTTLADFRRC